MTVEGGLTVAEAAVALGVSQRQVRHLAATGALSVLARGLVSREDVERRAALHSGWGRQAWSQRTAWAALGLLAGAGTGLLDGARTSRLRARLRGLGAAEFVGLARNRADVRRFRVHSSQLEQLGQRLVVGERSALGLAAVSGRLDGYVSADALQALVSEFFLSEDREGHAVLRVVAEVGIDLVELIGQRSEVLIALDLAESLDLRERRAGQDGLARLLGAFDG